MSPELRIAPPAADARVEGLLDAAFQRPQCESRLVRALERGYPDFDPGLALLAESQGEALGWALFLPRSIRVRGTWVRAAIAAPFAVLPHARRRGIASFLHGCALPALRDRSIRAAIVAGAPEFYTALGYEPAFDAYAVRVPVALLSEEEADPATWTGLAERHLEPLRVLQEACYASIDGSERRFAAAIEFESAAAGAHTLVLERGGTCEAYLRFRVRGELEISECGLRSRAALPAILGLLRRLAREHHRSRVELHLPPPHPLASALFHRGAVLEANNLGGASMMKVVDWRGLLQDTLPSWTRVLGRGRHRSISIELDGEPWRIAARTWRRPASVEPGRDPSRHLHVPRGWAAGLLTGQRSSEELLFEPEVRERSRLDAEGELVVRELFPKRFPMWTYAPVFEIADE